jgi:hypothetical protein
MNGATDLTAEQSETLAEVEAAWRRDPAAVEDALKNVLRPIVSNIVREPNEEKFRRIRENNRRVREAATALPCLFRILGACGFIAVDGPDTGVQVWTFLGDTSRLAEGNRLLSRAEEVLERNKAQQHLRTRKTATAHAASPPLRVEERREEAPPVESTLLFAADFESVRHLMDKARLTMHSTGRLRNACFSAKDMTLRRMEHGRGFVCRCPPDHLEAHWHVVCGKLLYAYVAHLTPSADAVAHLGYEIGYQYNSLPDSDLFRRVIHVSTKMVDTEGHLSLNDHPNRPAEVCAYCNTKLTDLLF